MNLVKPITVAIILIIIGIVFFILMFFNPISDIALAIAGLAFILSGFIQLGQIWNIKRDEEKLKRIINKLNEIQQSLEKVEQPKATGVAIADVISSGLKYYTEHMAKPKKKEEND
jgi:sulfite exporter TauE/SafE